MKNFVIISFILLSILLGVYKAEKINILFEKQDLAPEGVDYSNFYSKFVVGSSGTGQIHLVDRTGNVTQLTSIPELISSYGIQVDEENGVIYVTNNAIPFPMSDDRGSAAVVELETGRLLNFFDFTSFGTPNASKLINDITLPDKNQNIYVTESSQGIIFRCNLQTNLVDILIQDIDALGPSDLSFAGYEIGANGIELAVEEDGNEFLLVARTGLTINTANLYRIDLNTSPRLRSVSLPEIVYPGFDGLYYNKNTSHLFGVGGTTTILELQSSDNWRSATVVNTYPLTEPVITTCVAVQNSVFGLSSNGFQLNVTYAIQQGDDNEVDFGDDYVYYCNSSSFIVPSIVMVVISVLLSC